MTESSTTVKRKAIKKFILPLADKLGKMELKKVNLIGPKQVFLPNCGVHMNYYEREADMSKSKNRKRKKRKGHTSEEPRRQQQEQDQHQQEHQRTILLFHGFTSSAREFLDFIQRLDIPNYVRILIPEQIAHGEDLKRAFREGDSYQQPDANIMLNSTSEFLDVMQVGTNCNALGTSFGGVLLYYLKMKRSDIIKKAVLVSPAIPSCLADPFLNGLIDETFNFTEFKSRDDVVNLFRNYLWTDPQKRVTTASVDNNDNKRKKKKKIKKDPIPKFIYDVIYELHKRDVPRGHNRGLQDNLIRATGLRIKDDSNGITSWDNDHDDGDVEDIFLTKIDLDDKDSLRLVVWPEEDQICNYTKGKKFFESSVALGRTKFVTIPECGHVFNWEGEDIYGLAVPKVRSFLLEFENCTSLNHNEVNSVVSESCSC